jgi:hypothetical protein
MHNIKLCSGYGATHTSKNKPLSTVIWDEITALVDCPQEVEKSKSQWVIPSTLSSRHCKAQEEAGKYWMLWADIDHAPPSISTVADVIERTVDECCFEVYTTKSATQHNQKSRVLIPLDKPLSPRQWLLCQEILNNRIVKQSITPDRSSEGLAQILYLPNKGEHYDSQSNRSGLYFDPLVAFSKELAVMQETVKDKELAKVTRANASLNYKAPITLSSDTSNYGKTALEGECSTLATTPEGGRNEQLNKATFSISQLIAGGEVSEIEAYTALEQAALSCGLSASEIGKTLVSGFEAGIQEPRSAPPKKVVESFAWDTPKELKAELLPVKPLDPAMLPECMKDYVTDIAGRMDNSAPDYVAVAVMVALATLIGRKLFIAPKEFDTWRVVPNLWGAAIGRPSAKKTPSLMAAMAPLKGFEAKEFKKFCEATSLHEAQEMLVKVTSKDHETKLAKLVKDGKAEEAKSMVQQSLTIGQIDPPACKRYIVNDATVEKLGELLKDNPMGVMLFRDELTGWLNTLDKQGKEGDRAMYLECWAGTSDFTYDRIGRGTLRIESATLSIIGGIQPSKLIPYLAAQKSGKGDDGLIERFQLMVYPDASPFTHVDRLPNELAVQQASEIFAKLDELTGELDTPNILRFSPEAQVFFNSWYTDNQKLVRSGTLTPQLESHLAKYVSLFPSLALIIHAVDSGPEGEVGIASAHKALAWCEYLESHARRVYALVDGPIDSGKALQKRLHDLASPFRISAINNRNWQGLTTTEQVHTALNSLCEHGHLKKVISGTTRPATDYFKHPSYCKD